ncbi:P-loop containing nucleoside triphosphate hydrolase protein [Microdochium trichocladiopsis]|uniref:P-loop containing nucleoside triphosphate hydrolase protein n=1 Tax=Microdochium trichocladiopsis TaxID=1682393 RepID=A0A9P8XQ17_9PEZI|nr:P-loop containing nucleoside triphosphate hydrolase protein [Microdochium trichocladiopsis]KAH7010688.1 P-loop containing nucleoside triphosphate hydrolase protein [Microdochium trichocladiopsis]
MMLLEPGQYGIDDHIGFVARGALDRTRTIHWLVVAVFLLMITLSCEDAAYSICHMHIPLRLIHTPPCPSWTHVKSIRPISTVVMNEEVKAALIQDIEGFLHQEAPAWHLSRGIPYRKGYLLYGPPGTGKSSLCLSLAGRFDLDVYILNISAVGSHSLNSLLAELPPRCVLLLEDVDAVGIAQPRQSETDISQAKEDAARDRPRSQGKLSLSELLNALDGVSSHERRLLIMTTNHLDHLDQALIRASRVDKKIELPNADKDVMFRLFYMIFKQSEGDILDPKQPFEDDETVKRCAGEFAREIPEGEFSPAEIQSFLVEHRGSARVAVEKGPKVATDKEKDARIKEMKKSLSAEALCDGFLPGEFATYIKYTRGLAFDDEPDYSYLRQLFCCLFQAKGLKYDHVFDWTERRFKEMQSKVNPSVPLTQGPRRRAPKWK